MEQANSERSGTADVVYQSYSIQPQDRARLVGQSPVAVWLTGLPGSGKSTLANGVERRLHELGKLTIVLDGDNVRSGLNADLGFSKESRAENVRRVSEVARLMCDAGVIPIIALVSPFQEDRELARQRFEAGRFVEVFVDTPAKVCTDRDPKGLYHRAAQGEVADMTGVSQGYEPPANPEVHAHGDTDLAENIELVVAEILARQ